ncbi:MAG: ATP-binding protein [Acidimicrobiia bacterium]
MHGAPMITVSFPATPEYLRLARLATADVGSRAGFDYEEIDDLRIAVSELCSMISGAAEATLTLDFSFEPAAVTVNGAATPGALSENELSRSIVRAVVDDFEVTVQDGFARFQASKRARTR